MGFAEGFRTYKIPFAVFRLRTDLFRNSNHSLKSMNSFDTYSDQSIRTAAEYRIVQASTYFLIFAEFLRDS